MSKAQLDRLQKYSACDISDALLKLEVVPHGQRALAGFLDGIELRAGRRSSDRGNPKIIAPAFTVQFQPKGPGHGDACMPRNPASNIEPGIQWSDVTEEGKIVVIQQPEGQKCAVLGGIHAINIDRRGAQGIIVSGRIRDIQELQELDTPVWARGTSTVGASADSKAYAVQVPVTVSGVVIKPGDILFCDTAEGVVAIPLELLDDTLSFLSTYLESENKIRRAINEGMSVSEAFSRWRS